MLSLELTDEFHDFSLILNISSKFIFVCLWSSRIDNSNTGEILFGDSNKVSHLNSCFTFSIWVGKQHLLSVVQSYLFICGVSAQIVRK